MGIEGKRIRSLKQYIGFIERNSMIVIGVDNVGKLHKILKSAGFGDILHIGETILPSSKFGPISKYNAEGKYCIHKDQPMETAYREVEWHWREFRGRYNYEEMSDYRDVPYKRYPRTFVPPPSVEFQITKTTNGKRLIVTPTIAYNKRNEDLILHIINLYLEIFGKCEIYTENLDEIIKSPIKRLNWDILPQGRWPWTKLQKELRPIIKETPKGNRVLIDDRFKTINGYNPEFVAIGKAGFRGYVVFAFPKRDMFVLESIFPDNATYVFNKRWEILSQYTKAQILNGRLQKDRIIHLRGWHENIVELLGE